MQPLNNQFFKLLYVLLLFPYFNFKVIGQALDEDLIPDLYAKYEEAIRSNDTSTDENMVSLRRLFRNNKEYSVHVQKLKEVNGYKTHNLMIKGITRSNDTIIYINNPVESKIPNAYLTLDELKKVLTQRINSKKDAYSLLHKPKQHHNIVSRISISIRNTTKPRKGKVKIKERKIAYFSRTTIKVKKSIVSTTVVSTTLNMTQNYTNLTHKSKIQNNLTDSKQKVSTTTLQENIKPNQAYGFKLIVNNTTVTSKNLAKTYDTIDKTTQKDSTDSKQQVSQTTLQETIKPNQTYGIELKVENISVTSGNVVETFTIDKKTTLPFVKDEDVTQLNITEDNITKTLPKLSDDTVTVYSTTDSNIVTTQIEVTESEANTTEIQFNDVNDKIEKDLQNVLRNIDSNKTNENIVNVTENNLNKKVQDDDSSVTMNDNTTISDPSETTTSEGIVNSGESMTQQTEFWRLKRGKTKVRTTTKPKTTSTRRTYGRPRVFIGR